MRHTRQFPAKNEDGLVALLVVGIMIILLSLTTVAFTKLMGRESQQAVDRQLSTQAYYAAQSGINDAKDYLNTHPEALLDGSNCDVLAQKGYPPFLGPGSSVADNVNKVTCVVADSSPEQLFYQIPDGRSRIFEMSSTTPFSRILFSWDNADSTGNPAEYKLAGHTDFTTAGAWNSPTTSAPVLEVTYYPMPDADSDLPNLLSYSRTIFLYPARGAALNNGSTYDSSLRDGMIITNSCQNSTNLSANFSGATAVYHCNTIVNPNIQPAGTAPNHIFVKVSAFYGRASLAVRASGAGPNSSISIKNSQAVLDATGKGGSDVLKRLQTVVNYRQSDLEPSDAIETVVGLCKRLEYNLTTPSAQVDDPGGDPATFSQACHTAGSPDPL